MPIAATVAPASDSRDSTSPKVAATASQISSGSCSTHPGRGKCWGNSRYDEMVSPPVVTAPPAIVEPAVPVDPEIAEALRGASAARIATDIRNYVTRHYPERKAAVFDALTAAFEHHLAAGTLPPDAAEALVTLARDTRLKRTASWAADLLPRLLTQQAPAPE